MYMIHAVCTIPNYCLSNLLNTTEAFCISFVTLNRLNIYYIVADGFGKLHEVFSPLLSVQEPVFCGCIIILLDISHC